MSRGRRKRNRRQEHCDGFFDDFYDEEFAYIAGYTSNGVPYGSRWEEIGIDPDLPLEEKVTLLREGDRHV